MKEIIKLKYFVILLLFGFLLLPKSAFALATSVSEMSNEGYSIDANVEDKNGESKIDLKLTVPSSGSSVYYVYFVKGSNTAKPELKKFFKSDGTLKYSATVGDINIVSNRTVLVDDDWYIADGFEYAYIIKRTTSKNKYVYEVTQRPITVVKPSLPLSYNRYTVVLHPEFNKIEMSPNFPYGGEKSSYGDHKVAVKMAMITDTNILSKFQNSATDAYDTLLNYARQSNVQVYNLPDTSIEVNVSDFDIVENAVYYIYTTYVDETGLYRKIEGINVVMGTEDFFTTTIDWQNAVYEVKKDSTVLYIGVAVVAVVIIGIVSFVKFKDKKEAQAEKKRKDDFMNNFMNSVNNPNRQGVGTAPANTNPNPPNSPQQMPMPQNRPMNNSNGYPQNNYNNGYNNGMNGYPQNNYNNQNGYNNPNNYNNQNNYNNYNNQNNNRY